jgi:hypothetical protein
MENLYIKEYSNAYRLEGYAQQGSKAEDTYSRKGKQCSGNST